MAEPGVSRSATRMLDFDATNVAGEICDSEMTVTLRKARDITAARCARRANVPATNRIRNEMSSLFSIPTCETTCSRAVKSVCLLCRSGFQPQAAGGDCAAPNQSCFNRLTGFVRAQNVLHRINVGGWLAHQRNQYISQQDPGFVSGAPRFNVYHQQSFTGG